MNTYNTTVEGCRLYSQARSMAYHMEHSLLWISTIWRFSCDIYVCVHTSWNLYLYTRLRLPFNNFHNISFPSRRSLPFFPFLSCVIGSCIIFSFETITRTYTYVYSKFEKPFDKIFSILFHRANNRILYILSWQLSNCGFFLENQRQFFHGTK